MDPHTSIVMHNFGDYVRVQVSLIESLKRPVPLPSSGLGVDVPQERGIF
jgi:hypothetical protein